MTLRTTRDTFTRRCRLDNARRSHANLHGRDPITGTGYRMRISLRFVAATLIAASSPALVLAEEASSDAERIGRLEEQVKALEARTPSVRADSSGLSISSPAFSFQFKGLVQLDGRWFTSDSVPQSADTFTFRRIRPTFQGTVGDFIAYRLTPEFAGDSATI